MPYYSKDETDMEYIFNQIVLVITAFILGIGTVLEPPASPSAASVIGTSTAQVAQVIDGDTIAVTLGTSSRPLKVRYIGIDTPEPYAHQTPDCGSNEASVRNRELVENKLVTLIPGRDPYDTYGRLLAYVYVDDIFVNEQLVREGYASVLMIQPNTQYRTHFTNLYTNARIHRLGMWSLCD